LTLIRATASTSRVLNLAALSDRHKDDPDLIKRPMFRNRRLNHSIIIKHIPRAGERDLVRNTIATKVILPFCVTDLRLGGVTFFAEQDHLERVLNDQVGGYASREDAQSDIGVLREIAAIPSLDPFLLRERLRRAGYEIARAYFDISDADLDRMYKFVGDEIYKLVSLAFARSAANVRELSGKLAHKLLTDENAEALDALRITLGLSGEEYREGVFAWKGFLYYKWSMASELEQLAPLSRDLLGCRVIRTNNDEKAYLASCRQNIINHMSRRARMVHAALNEYSEAFREMVEMGRPAAFRDFLLSAPALFLQTGDSVSSLKHVASYWRFRFPDSSPRMLEAEEAIEMFQDFEASLGMVAA
jgi:hypothetical protein